jgi:hypothetical protein
MGTRSPVPSPEGMERRKWKDRVPMEEPFQEEERHGGGRRHMPEWNVRSRMKHRDQAVA